MQQFNVWNDYVGRVIPHRSSESLDEDSQLVAVDQSRTYPTLFVVNALLNSPHFGRLTTGITDYMYVDFSKPHTMPHFLMPPFPFVQMDDPGWGVKLITQRQLVDFCRLNYPIVCDRPIGERCVPSRESFFVDECDLARESMGYYHCSYGMSDSFPACLSPFAGRWFEWVLSSATTYHVAAHELALGGENAVAELVTMRVHALRKQRCRSNAKLDFNRIFRASSVRKRDKYMKQASVFLCAQLTTIETARFHPTPQHYLIGESGVRLDCVHVVLHDSQREALCHYLNGILRARRQDVSFDIHLGLLSDLLTLFYASRIHYSPCLQMAAFWLDNASNCLGSVVYPKPLDMTPLQYAPKFLAFIP